MLMATLLLTGCGSKDASGIYVLETPNEVTLVQLIEDKDHKLTGRIEVNTIAPDSTVTGKTASLDGSVSGNDLILRPASAWLGGLEASGTYSSNTLHLTGKGFDLTAKRSSLDEYQEAVSKLKSVAADRQEKQAKANAELRQEEARAEAERDVAASISAIREAALRVSSATSRLSEGISKSPDFAKLAAANTARVSRMLAAASKMSELQRSQLGVEANQVIVGTNQIEVARDQYAIGLNTAVNDAKQAAMPIARLCGGKPAPRFAAVCGEALIAMNAFKATVARGQASFSPYKQRVAAEMKRQEELAARIDG